MPSTLIKRSKRVADQLIADRPTREAIQTLDERLKRFEDLAANPVDYFSDPCPNTVLTGPHTLYQPIPNLDIRVQSTGRRMIVGLDYRLRQGGSIFGLYEANNIAGAKFKIVLDDDTDILFTDIAYQNVNAGFKAFFSPTVINTVNRVNPGSHRYRFMVGVPVLGCVFQISDVVLFAKEIG